MSDNNEMAFRCTIKRMFNGCPKPDGWFGCFAHVRGQDIDVKLTGMTTVNLTKGMQLDVTAKPSLKEENAWEITELKIVTKTLTGLVAYLSSIYGVSKQTANSIVATYGNDTIDMLKEHPDEVKQELQLKDKQINAILTGLNKTDDANKLRTFLPELHQSIITRILELYKEDGMSFDDLKQKIIDNPYALRSIPGISFPAIDTIALRLGTDPFAPYRVNHGLIYLLENDASGNLFINLSNNQELQHLCIGVENLLKIRFKDINDFAVRLQQFAAIEDSPIIIEAHNNEAHLYLTKMYQNMMYVVDTINTLNHSNPITSQYSLDLNGCIQAYQNQTGFKLTSEQHTAVVNAICHKISIITGGPGRGKTSVIDCIASCWPLKNDRILLLAPTGKAMNKLKNATNAKYQTMTIDRLIATVTNARKASVKQQIMRYNAPETLIIIDESSMIDLEKITSLFSIMQNCQYCFVGDIDQLPPISPGRFLTDLINSNQIATTYLTKAIRNGGLILSNADKINANDTNLQYDFYQMPMYPQDDDDQMALDFIIDQYMTELQNNPDITQLALLAPMRKSITGTINMNIAIQEIMCPEIVTATPQFDRANNLIYTTKGYPINSTIYGNGSRFTHFRVGDIVMNTKNNNSIVTNKFTNNDYFNGTMIDEQNGIFNGDCGRIIAYRDNMHNPDMHENIVIQFFDNRIAAIDVTLGDFEHFELGYALTVHKSQGCEYDTVIYVSPKAMLGLVDIGFATKNLVYTAITRAKKRVVIIGSKESLNACITHNIHDVNSNMASRITP